MNVEGSHTPKAFFSQLQSDSPAPRKSTLNLSNSRICPPKKIPELNRNYLHLAVNRQSDYRQATDDRSGIRPTLRRDGYEMELTRWTGRSLSGRCRGRLRWRWWRCSRTLFKASMRPLFGHSFFPAQYSYWSNHQGLPRPMVMHTN